MRNKQSLVTENVDQRLANELHQYFGNSFLRLSRSKINPNSSLDCCISDHYLAQFTNFIIVPTKQFYASKPNILGEIGSVWLRHYANKMALDYQTKSLNGANKPVQLINELQLFEQWQLQINAVHAFYRTFDLRCPVCLESVPKYNNQSDVLNLLLNHKCVQTSSNIGHHCPCGQLFPDHMSFLNHILPAPNKNINNLALSICPVATFYWLFVAIRSLDSNTNYSTAFCCSNCDPIVSSRPESISVSINLDFFSWLYHLGFDCPYFLQQIVVKGDNKICFFCPIEVNKNQIVKKVDYKSSILNCLSTDFNLNQFKMYDFFDFCLDFNLSQKRRPSDFLGQCKFPSNVTFSRDELTKIDFVFLNYPYSCSKCFKRFKDVSLKYNHDCLNSHTGQSKKSDHICRCGMTISGHSSFWYHILNKCFLLTCLHMLIFSLVKKVSTLQCFCNRFYVDSNSISKFLLHWNSCHVAYGTFLRSCRHCHLDSNVNNDLNRNRVVICEPTERQKKMAQLNENNHFFKQENQSSLSLVANRRQIFSLSQIKYGLTKNVLDNLKSATVNKCSYFEQAAIIQSAGHLLQTSIVKVHAKSKITAKCYIPEIKEANVIVRRCGLVNVDNTYEHYDIFKDSDCIYKFAQMSPIYSFNRSNCSDIHKRRGLFYTFNSIKRLLKSIKFRILPIQSRQLNREVVQYLEEPDNSSVTKFNYSKNNVFKKFKKRYFKRNHVQLRSNNPMLPMFRKIAILKQQTVSKNQPIVELQYLEPSFHNTSITNESQSISEIDTCCKEVANILMNESEESETFHYDSVYDE